MDRRVRRTRRQLRDALLALVMEQGYERVTIQQITDRADLSRATFYLHYKEKDELLADSLESLFDELVESLDSSLIDLDWQKPGYEPSAVVFDHVDNYRDLYSSLFLGDRSVSYVSNRAINYIAGVVQKNIEALVPQDMPSLTRMDTIAYFVAGSLFALLLQWLDSDMEESPESMAAIYQRMVMPSVVAAVGLQEQPAY